ncbi:Clp protease ClpP [Pararhizobium sp. BT-229]|uniref:head maturation protease, ClpP-related n=1 Tax=Pararhizobium sp. BT-229 TaxID=2986923 RepID=UPI0021F73B2E|nr:head maturation protease, ClpP-related [Pararhizobium sp. BT-229]MCV9960741.1 Clp protease ClpP [Pararhizobium sp. BT-229]
MEKLIIDLAPFSASKALNRAARSLGPGSVRVNANDDAADIYIYGDIGGWWDGIQAEDIVREIADLTVDTLNVHVNSGGGIVFDGMAIYNAFAAHKANIVMHIDGIAASIASVIVMAGDEIRIGESANIMIHKPWSFMIGDAEEMRAEADILDNLEQGIVDIYAARTDKDDDALKKLMWAETWMRGQQAVDEGFADSVIPNKKKEKKAARSALLQLYEHTPSDLMASNGDVPQVREFERLLRDGEKMPNAVAKRLAAAAQRVFQPVRGEQDPDPRDEGGNAAFADVAAAFDKATALFRT